MRRPPTVPPRGYFHITRSGALDLTSSLEAKFGARSDQLHQKLGKFCYYKMQKLGEIPVLGTNLKFRRQNLGYLSPLFFEVKFGAPTRILEGNFGGKAPRPPNMEIPPGLCHQLKISNMDQN